MDALSALSAAVEHVEAERQRDGDPQRSASRLAPYDLGVVSQLPPPLYDPQQQPWYAPMDGHGPASPAAVATTPTMRLAGILNDEPMDGDESDVEFIGAGNSDDTGRPMEPHWRHANASPTTAGDMRSGARISNGDVSTTAGGGFAGVGWPTGVLRVNVIDSSATGGRYQPSPAAGQRNQQLQSMQPLTTKKPITKRERAAPSRVPSHQKQLPVAAPAARTKTASAVSSMKKRGVHNVGMWTDAEKAAFEEGVLLYGIDYIKIAKHIGTRHHGAVSGYGKRWRKNKGITGSASTPSGGGNLQQSEAHEDDDGAQSIDHDNALAGETVSGQPVAARVLDLSNKKTSQRPRRGARHQETVGAAAQVVNEVIEINTEESSVETPQKAPQRVTGARPPRAQQRSVAKNTSTNQVVVAQPQRKKPKLSGIVRAGVNDAPPRSPSSSVTSSVSQSKKRSKKWPQHEFNGIDSPTSLYLPFPSTAAPEDDRKCEFCKVARGVCVTMHCTQCKRVYHPKCLVNHFKPFCQLESDEPVEAQLEKLHLSAPSQIKTKMLRCAPCNAVLLDNIRRDSYGWDCECPSCKDPERLANHRREMVIQFLVHHVDEKPPKQKSKATKQEAVATGAAKKPAAPAPTRTGTRRTRNNSAVPGSENDSVKMDSEASMDVAAPAVEAKDVMPPVGGKKHSRSSKQRYVSNSSAAEEPETNGAGEDGAVENGDESNIVNDANQEDDVQMVDADNEAQRENAEDNIQMDQEEDNAAVAEPDQEKEASTNRSSPKSAPAQAAEPELTNNELLATVPVSMNGSFETFRIVCTETPSLTASGVMKEGTYFLHRDRMRDYICCSCCEKSMTHEMFVNHTDNTFHMMLSKTPWNFLFAHHHDGSASPLRRFLDLLNTRSATVRDVVGGVLKQKSLKTPAVEVSVTTGEVVPAEDGDASVDSLQASLDDARSQLELVLIARRVPGSTESRSSSSSNSKPAYLIRLVCVSKEMTYPMPDGIVQNTVDRSTGGYPFKDGWLYFDKGTGTGSATAVSPSYAHVLCDCCSLEMDLGDFIAHAGIDNWDRKFKRRYVYVPLRGNQRALVDLERVWQAILLLSKHQQLDAFTNSLSSVAVRL